MRLRFAPSPTGYLHVGNARPALINWLFARRNGGKFILRLDDTDVERSRPEYAEGIETDMRWLGLDWDEFFRQSDRLDRYALAAEHLKETGRLYPCFESEDELKFKREAKLKRGLAPVYDRAMLRMTPEQRAQAEANGKKPYWRFRLSDGPVTWNDMILGDRQVKLTAISDPVLIREDGSPLYTFTSVVDDLETSISHIIRGEDHISNTGVQLDIWEALGGKPSAIKFGHLPLLVAADGGKLSKRTGSISLRGLRGDGVEPQAITSYLARLGSSDDPEPLPLEKLKETVDLSHYSRASARFDPAQLLALNRRILHEASFEDVRERLPAGATEAFWHAVRGNLDWLAEAGNWLDVVNGDITPPDQEDHASFLASAGDCLPAEPWDGTTWKSWTDTLKESTGRKGKTLFLPLRIALTGEEHGPELATLLPLIGRECVLKRLATYAL